MIKSLLKTNYSELILYFVLICIGGFNEFASCITSILLATNLIIKLKNKRELVFKLNTLSVSVLLLVFLYLISFFWAVDSGMAFIGFLKFFPLILFLLSLYQEKEFNFETVMPIFVSLLSVVTIICMQIDVLHKYFSVADRFSGIFQYPNTFALLLLICELLVLKQEKLTLINYATITVLVFSLFYTGSRIVFVLFVISNLLVFIIRFYKRIKFFILIALGFLIVGALLLFILRDNPVISRYLRISVFESTFIGRLLYYYDAIPLTIKNPFGLGYLGYSYVQYGIQTGMYNVRYVHNDFLQIALDIGIIPALIFVFAVIKSFFSKSINIYYKIIIAVIALHSCLDFDLQFLFVFMFFIMIMNDNSGNEYVIKCKAVLSVSFVAIIIANLYMSLALTLSHFGAHDISEKLYKFNTDNKTAIIEKEKDLDVLLDLADEISAQNSAIYIPYSVKSKYYYSIGDYKSLIENKRMLFERNRFRYKEYEEYCQMLIYGAAMYMESGDNESAKICRDELLYTKERLSRNADFLSNLGKRIPVQPKTELPDDILNYISMIDEALK